MSSAIKNKKRARPTEGPSIAAEIELALARKKALDTELLNLERQIYALETSYLENTAQLGDLIRGWGDFTNPTSPGGPGGSTQTKRKKKIHDQERIFSSSSVSAQKNPEFSGLNPSIHASIASVGPNSRSHHAVGTAATLEEETDDFATSLTLDMDVDTPSRPKVGKKSETTSKKSRSTAPRSTPKPSKQTNTMLSDPDSLGSFQPHEDIFEQ